MICLMQKSESEEGPSAHKSLTYLHSQMFAWGIRPHDGANNKVKQTIIKKIKKEEFILYLKIIIGVLI